ncbi:MAG: urea ABC transporter permease subunit UrtB [Egibacteraceae bacterium]
METILSPVFAGLSVSAVLLLIALGLTLTFGQMNVINMAHGELIMVGAYTTYVLQRTLPSADVAYLLALPLAFLLAGLLGLGLERSVIRRLYGRPLDTLLATWGISLLLQQLARDVFGASNVQTQRPSFLEGGISVGSLTLPWSRIAILGLATVTVVVLALVIARLPYGRRMRAVLQNRQLAAVTGVRTERVDGVTFFIGSALAGLAGVALTLLGSVGPTLGTSRIVDAFLVVIVGGLGRLHGAVLAALGIGMLNAVVEQTTQASVAKAVVFAGVIALLQVRPQGLFAHRSRALV